MTISRIDAAITLFASALAMTALTGCAAFEARAPRPFAPHTEEKDGVVVTESTYESEGGWVHFERSWRPKADARGVLVVVHGLKDHSARYGDFAISLAKQGFSVRSYDHRGHGRSDGKSQRVDDFADYLSDLDSFVKRSKKAEGALPVFVLGHSMGGAIATGYVLDHQADVNGLLLSAPALAADAGGGAKFGAHFASALFPGAGALSLPIDKFSRAPDVIAAAKSDPLVDLSDVPARTVAGLLDTMDRIAEHRAEFTLPILAIHGEADEITLPRGSKEFVTGAASKDRSLWSCPKLVHDLLHEPEHDAIIRSIGEWLSAHAPAKTGDAAAGSPVTVPAPCQAVKL